jgi:hypothetical protein
MTYRLLDVDGVTFKVSTARREGFAAEGNWEWCLYDRERPGRAVLLSEFAALPSWARAVRDTPRA